MPWVKRSHRAKIYFWIAGALAMVAVAAVIGYELGNTTSVVDVVENHLAKSEAQLRRLEKRVQALEAQVGIPADRSAKATSDVH